ncbi:ATP-binding cassette domain-containing protein [Staphylococcus sp. SQ8-PEA]|uniref:ATP-binding cassette domain-containing protein n=1 Tax=Staphylococcus marylandisciuri TaxID=2981529 RepID=A0ABT2QQI7_9STAP|nr:ATP-binding cassette domain-containing protein [Staphylococcus marylandisciuri]MCU5746235.1 ATP-binding cassette domain-containing protein [Staphylococcus marylandisciuri]
MGSSIILKLLNVTHYYRNKKPKKWYLPFNYDAESIELNNISLHIYEGESLGIIGEPNSSKSLVGRILAGEIKPDKGKYILRSDLYYADIADKHLHTETVETYIKQHVLLFPVKVNDHKVSQIMRYAHLEDKKDTTVSELSDALYAQLLFSIARTCHAQVLIFNRVIQSLSDNYFEEAIKLSNEYINNNLTMIIIDDDLERIPQVTNYLAWISHGQLRKEGSIRQVLPLFKEHESDRRSIVTQEEEENFDRDWKESRTHMPELTYNFKRVERYNHAKPPTVITRFWTILVASIIAMLLMIVLIFGNMGNMPVPTNTDQATIQDQSEHAYKDKLAYGLVLDKKITMHGLKHASNRQAQHYSFLTITGESPNHYRVEVDGKSYSIAKNEIRYFDPGGLYEQHSGDKLAKYMSKNYSHYYEFFNSHLHQQHHKVTDSLVPEKGKDNRFVVPVTQQPISMIFNDENKLSGFTFPMKNVEKLKSDYHISSKIWIAKSGDGYYIADMKNKNWIYIEL